jgi:hypothetical protein
MVLSSYIQPIGKIFQDDESAAKIVQPGVTKVTAMEGCKSQNAYIRSLGREHLSIMIGGI